MRIVILFMLVFLLNFQTWLCPVLVWGDWDHKAIKRPGDFAEMKEMEYIQSNGQRCGNYYQEPFGIESPTEGKWITYSDHDPWTRFRQVGEYRYPSLYFSTEQEASAYLERWCKTDGKN